MAEQDREQQRSPNEPARESEAAAEPERELDRETLWAMMQGARAERDQLQTAADEMKSLAQRVQADFVNYKRRVEAEQGQRAEAVRAETLQPFLTIADDLERALAHLPAESAGASWAEGFNLIQRNLAAAFERLGVTRVGEVGEQFDPTFHEAVAYEENRDQPEGHVATVVRPGYRLGERVIRPAQVVVARAPKGVRIWPPHRMSQPYRNGDADPRDLEQPKGIDRARES
jgi:molecular chaperone GrpE